MVMLHLAMKAFAPCPLPFPVMHVDTGHNFDEVLDFRDRPLVRSVVPVIFPDPASSRKLNIFFRIVSK